MFGLNKDRKETSRWKITDYAIEDNVSGKKYGTDEVNLNFSKDDEALCIWHMGKHLVTIKCSEKIYAAKGCHYAKAKHFIPPFKGITVLDVDGRTWVTSDGEFKSDGKTYSLAGLRFVSSGEKIDVYHYGKHVITLKPTDIDALNQEKDTYLEHKHFHLSNSLTPEQMNPVTQAHLSNVIVTTEMQPDLPIAKRIEVISAEVAYGMNIFKDVFTVLSDTFGGRSQSLQNTLKDARQLVITELRREARSIGADAVIAVDLDFSEFSGGGKSMLFVVATGTAVKLKRQSN